jgi:hypothetical protein
MSNQYSKGMSGVFVEMDAFGVSLNPFSNEGRGVFSRSGLLKLKRAGTRVQSQKKRKQSQQKRFLLKAKRKMVREIDSLIKSGASSALDRGCPSHGEAALSGPNNA